MATLTSTFQLLAQKELGKVYNSNKAYIRLYGRVSSSGPDIANNQTKVYLEARLYNESTWYASSGTYYRLTGSGSIDSGNISKLTTASSMWAKGEVTLGSVSGYVGHNADGTRTIHAEAQFVSSPWGWNVTASASGISLPTIPRQANILTAPNFNDEQNPTITYENKAGNSVSSLQACISLTGSTDDIKYRDINKTGTLSYTFNLTEDERNVLRKATSSNKRTVWFYVRSIIGGNTFYSKIEKVNGFSIINGNPVFNDFVFEDVNQDTVKLTGNNQSIIAGYSDVKVTIPVANKAIAQKQATMSKYRFNSIDANYSDSNDVSITSNKVTTGDFTVYAIDSRGNSKPVTKNATNVINYTPLQKGNITANRQNGVSPITTLKFNGKWWNGIFGQKETDSHLRNIQVGDDLSGKTIYCKFPDNLGDELKNDGKSHIPVITCTNSSSTAYPGYINASAHSHGEGLDGQTVICDGVSIYSNCPICGRGINLSSLQLSDTFGVVTEIDTSSSAYKYIFIEGSDPVKEDVNNTIKARYRYSIAGEENYIDGETPIELTINENDFSFEGLIAGDLGAEGFDINNAYNIQVIIDDELSQVVFTANLGSGTPHIAYAKNGIGVMTKYDSAKGGALQVGGNLDVNGEITVQGSSSPVYVGVKGDKGDTGPQGPQGPRGERGETGATGTEIEILGAFETLEELQEQHPTGERGDIYLVGDYLYVWDVNNNRWVQGGNISTTIGDTLPIGTIVEYDGSSVPIGYELIDDDTGWLDLSFPDTSIANQYNTFEKCQYRRIGDFLYLKGLVNIPTIQNGLEAILANIPNTSCRPNTKRYVTVSCSSNETGKGSKAVTITINTDGNIKNHNSYIAGWLSLDGIVIGL